MREAAKQIEACPGGIILDASLSELAVDVIEHVIEDRIRRIALSSVDVMIVSDEDLKKTCGIKNKTGSAAPANTGRGSSSGLGLNVLSLLYTVSANYARGGEKILLDKKTVEAIEAILKRGNDAKVRRKGGGYVVIELKETIKYSPPPIVAGEGQ